MYSLYSHENQYQFSPQDALLSLVTGFSGASYAKRHWDLSQPEPEAPVLWAHRVIAVIEMIPLLGGLAALVERVVFAVFFERSYQELMRANVVAASEEHRAKDPHAYVLLNDQSVPSVENMVQPKESPLIVTGEAVAESQGPMRANGQYARAYMEDAHLIVKDGDRMLVGVLDGHAQLGHDGRQVSNFAKEEFEREFFPLLNRMGGDVRHTFEVLIDKIHQRVLENPEWRQIGTTAVMSFVDLRAHCIYTATLGDSEANIYRRGEGGLWRSIPLSLVRDWGSAEDGQRRDAIYQTYSETLGEKPKSKDGTSKGLRTTGLEGGASYVARSIGDAYMNWAGSLPGVIHRPEVTLYALQPGDRLILACDGLKDYVSETEIIQLVSENPNAEVLTQALTAHAIANMGIKAEIAQVVRNIAPTEWVAALTAYGTSKIGTFEENNVVIDEVMRLVQKNPDAEALELALIPVIGSSTGDNVTVLAIDF